MANKDRKDNRSVASAVRGAGSNLSAREAMQISKQTGASTAQIFARAQQQGVGIGSAAINKFNAGKLGTNFTTQVQGPYGISYNPRADAKTSQALSQLGAIQGLRMQPGTSYRGYSSTNGQYNPIVLPKDMLKASGMGGSQTRGAGPYDNLTIPKATPGEGPGPWAGGYGMVGNNTATAPTEEPTTVPKTVEEMVQDSSGDAFYGFGGASSWRSAKRGKGKGIKSTSAASRSQRSSPYSNMLGMK